MGRGGEIPKRINKQLAALLRNEATDAEVEEQRIRERMVRLAELEAEERARLASKHKLLNGASYRILYDQDRRHWRLEYTNSEGERVDLLLEADPHDSVEASQEAKDLVCDLGGYPQVYGRLPTDSVRPALAFEPHPMLAMNCLEDSCGGYVLDASRLFDEPALAPLGPGDDGLPDDPEVRIVAERSRRYARRHLAYKLVQSLESSGECLACASRRRRTGEAEPQPESCWFDIETQQWFVATEPALGAGVVSLPLEGMDSYFVSASELGAAARRQLGYEDGTQ